MCLRFMILCECVFVLLINLLGAIDSSDIGVLLLEIPEKLIRVSLFFWRLLCWLCDIILSTDSGYQFTKLCTKGDNTVII